MLLSFLLSAFASGLHEEYNHSANILAVIPHALLGRLSSRTKEDLVVMELHRQVRWLNCHPLVVVQVFLSVAGILAKVISPKLIQMSVICIAQRLVCC